MARKTTDQRSALTPYDNLLYLLFEIEQAVQHSDVRWSRRRTEAVRRRLTRIVQQLARLAEKGAREQPIDPDQ
jgi:hypothetical protein